MGVWRGCKGLRAFPLLLCCLFSGLTGIWQHIVQLMYFAGAGKLFKNTWIVTMIKNQVSLFTYASIYFCYSQNFFINIDN